MTLVEKLTQWNGGEERGAASRLARETGASPGLVSAWISGSMPGKKYLLKVCVALGTTEDELATIIRRTRNSSAHSATTVKESIGKYSNYSYVEVPHFGVVSASRFSFSFDSDPEHFSTLAVKGSAGTRHALLRISGDCMAPKIEDGDEVMIREQNHVEDGDVAVVCFDGECTMKRIYRRRGGVELHADNPAFESKVYPTNKIQVLAKVVKILKDPGKAPG